MYQIIVLFFYQLGCLLSNTDWKVNIFFAGESVWELHSSVNKNPEKQGLFLSPVSVVGCPGRSHLSTLKFYNVIKNMRLSRVFVQPTLMCACQLLMSYFTSCTVGLFWWKRWKEEKKACQLNWLSLRKEIFWNHPNNFLLDLMANYVTQPLSPALWLY